MSTPSQDPAMLDATAMQALVSRVRGALADAEPEEKRMFGGVAFMVTNHMLCCVSKRGLLVRVGKEAEPEALARPHARRCEGTGRPMPGFITVAPPGVGEDGDLADWLRMARTYVSTLPPKNPRKATR